jgi:putative ABC transport system permease protein
MPDPREDALRPDWAPHVRKRLSSSLRLSPTREREIVDELSQHLDDRWRELVSGGASPEEAERLALREFRDRDTLARFMAPLRQAHTPPGGEVFYDHQQYAEGLLDTEDGDVMITGLPQDLRYAAVTSWRQPAISLGIILTIALGIGAMTGIFSVVNALLIRPLPYPNPERLVSFGVAEAKGNSQLALLVPALLTDLQARSRSVQQFWGFSPVWSFTLTNAGNPYRLPAAYISPGLMEGLGFQFVAGRNFLPTEDVTGGEPVVLVTKAFWNRTFGASTQVGQTVLTLDGRTYRVVGVINDGKALPTVEAEVFLPFSLNPFFTSRVAPVMNVIGSLREGVTLSHAQAEMAAITEQVRKDYLSLKTRRIVVTSLRELVVGDLRRTLLMLFAAGGFLVLIACVNIANLLLSRAMAREQEIALRTALGATHRRLVQQLLTESLFLAIVGGLLGLGLAYVVVLRLIPLIPFAFALSNDIQIDRGVLGFTGALSVAMGLLFGLAPAVHAARPNLIRSLKSGTRTSMGASSRQLWNVLVVAEVALSVVVLVSAGLLIRSFWNLSHVDPGFRTERILTTNISLPETRYKDAASQISFWDQLTERLKTLPGVQFVGVVNRLPLSGANVMIGVTVDGSPLTADKPEMVDRRMADPDYFRTMGVPLIKGRYFAAGDTAKSAKVAIINEELARRFWPTDEPIGRNAVLVGGKGFPVTIVGVVRNILHHGLDTQVQPELYVPYTQAAPQSMIVALLTMQPSVTLNNAVRAEVAALDPQLPLDKMPTMEQVVATSISRPRFRMILLSSFAVLALLLSAIGIYSVVSYATSRRCTEIAIRMALGAQRSSVMMLVLGQGAKLVITGIVIGLAASFMLMQFLRTLLFGISDSDPVTLIAVAALMAVVALVACYLPVRRALQTDPLAALRVD